MWVGVEHRAMDHHRPRRHYPIQFNARQTNHAGDPHPVPAGRKSDFGRLALPRPRSGNFQLSTSRYQVPRPLARRTANASHYSFDKSTISHYPPHAMRPGQPWQKRRGSLGPTPILMAQNHSFPIKLFPNCALSLQNNYKRLSMSRIQIKCRAFCIQVNQAKSNLIKASRVIFWAQTPAKFN
jgi:hypothetical protein